VYADDDLYVWDAVWGSLYCDADAFAAEFAGGVDEDVLRIGSVGTGSSGSTGST